MFVIIVLAGPIEMLVFIRLAIPGLVGLFDLLEL